MRQSITSMLKPKKKTKKSTVLVVEDDENIAFYLKYMLQREGLNPVMVPDGRAALDVIERFRPPKLILMDIKLPFIDGARLVQHVRARPKWALVPIILLTSVSEERVINRALSAGANEYMVKPFLTLELIARVRHYVPEGEL
ncbi:MAG: putative response regulator, CheY [Cyanobacteria bacterium RYN_339]|nr:putative response regulator, CheY [Cyanobacteria bacterium RYN_339]